MIARRTFDDQCVQINELAFLGGNVGHEIAVGVLGTGYQAELGMRRKCEDRCDG